MLKKRELDFYEFYNAYKNIFKNGSIDLSEYDSIHPWSIIWILIKLIDSNYHMVYKLYQLFHDQNLRIQ